MANSVDPDQTVPIGAVCSGSPLFAAILNFSVMLGNYLQQTTSADNIYRCNFFLGTLRVNSLHAGLIFQAFFSKLTFSIFFLLGLGMPSVSVKQFRSRSDQAFCLTWSGSKLFSKIINRGHTSRQRVRSKFPYLGHTKWFFRFPPARAMKKWVLMRLSSFEH